LLEEGVFAVFCVQRRRTLNFEKLSRAMPPARHRRARRSLLALGSVLAVVCASAEAVGAAAAVRARAPALGQRRVASRVRLAAGDDARGASSGAPLSAADALPPAAAIWRVALPLFAACMCEPALTLIDTACVGNLGAETAAGLAALAVNGAVFDVLANVLSSLCTASTGVVATAATKGAVALRRAVALSLAISLAIGACCGALVFGSSDFLTRNVFGIASPLVAGRALAYMRVRAVFVPVVCANYALYGVLLARGDTAIAVKAVGASALCNVILDILLVGGLGLSTAGAAVATVVAQGVVCAVLGAHVLRTLPAAPPPPALATAPARARWRVSAAELEPFGSIFGAVGLGTATTALVHAAGARLVAGSGDVAAAAAYQVGFQAVSLLSCLAVPLNLGVQSLLASARARGDGARARALVFAVLGQSAMVGAGAGLSAAVLLRWGARLLTADAAVVAALRAVVPLCAATAAAWCVTSALYGVFVALRLLGPFVAVHALGAAGALAVLARGAGVLGSPLTHAWVAALAYSSIRLVVYAPVLRGALGKLRDADAPSSR
jgi:Na+-driven multidrug efflux pump